MRCIEDPLARIENIVSSIEETVVDSLRAVSSETCPSVPRSIAPSQHPSRVNIKSNVDLVKVVRKLENSLSSLRAEIDQAARQREESESSNSTLAKAQAEALVNSAEIISELEDTKQKLKVAHEAEREAKMRAERLSNFGNIIDESSNEIFIFDCRSLHFVHANQGARRNIGYSMDELREMTPLDLKPHFDIDSFERLIQPIRSNQTNTVCFSTIHQRKNGSRYPVEIHLYRTVFEDQAVFLAVVLDTTEKQQAEDEIRKLSAAVEQSPAAVVITNVNGNVEYVNPMFTQTTGCSREEALLQDAQTLLAPHFTGNRYQEMRETIQAGRYWRGEIELEKERGQRSWESISVSQIRNANQETTHLLTTFQDVTDNKLLLEQMEDLAFHDSLTGLPNRSSILQTIQQAIDDGQDNPFAILFLDFDRFKLINDSLGHNMGDELLIQISDRLRRNIRSSDSIIPARLGGDEFIVLINHLAEWNTAQEVAERLLEIFSSSYQICGNTIHSSVSIGIVTNQQGYTNANDMLRDADIAMYEAKSKGRGCYALFDQSMHQRADTRLRVESDLRQAIKNNEFVLHYQPILSLQSGQIDGVESLVRWNHPDRGMVSPDEFIPIAEETRLIVPIGKLILDEACRQFSEWQTTLGVCAPPCIHVNVSRMQILLPDFCEFVTHCLEKHDLAPHCLHLEITESMVMEDVQTIVRTLNALRSIGVKIDMDDFGTGHSSLACLQDFPLDMLKIDRSFINNASNVRQHVTLLRAIVTLAENLHLPVVAEGVECADQLRMLKELGCDYAQGYYFSKPLSADDFETYASSRKGDEVAIRLPLQPFLDFDASPMPLLNR